MPHKTRDGHWAFSLGEMMEWMDKRPAQLGVYFGWSCPYCWGEYQGNEKECANCGARVMEKVGK
jgi:rRNA maturation endonuclease Nob1